MCVYQGLVVSLYVCLCVCASILGTKEREIQMGGQQLVNRIHVNPSGVI